MATTLSFALAYRKLGWSVFPLQNKSKKPAIGSWEPYQHRLATEAEIRAWWTNSDKGIAIVTGAISGDLLVLDCDPRHDGDLTLANMPRCTTDCPTVKTGGGGSHFYYHTPSKCVPAIAQGLDVKGEGGYVVAPPSIHPDTGIAYAWYPDANPYKVMIPPPPDWLTALLTKYKSLETQSGNPPGWVAQALSGAQNGNRDNTCIKLAGYFRNLLPQAVTQSILEMWGERCNPAFSQSEIIKTVDSAYKYHGNTTAQEVLDSFGSLE